MKWKKGKKLRKENEIVTRFNEKKFIEYGKTKLNYKHAQKYL